MTDNSILLYPLLFDPALKDYVWGGRNLERLCGRKLPPGPVAESWEIAAHQDGSSKVQNGPLAGRTLRDLHATYGYDLIGTNSKWAQERHRFPLLVKLLDANDRLSVQVHPDDNYSQRHEKDELGKTEMWVILHAEPDAQVILGLSENVPPSEFAEAVTSNELSALLHRLDVRVGDFLCVPSGSLHAILGGIVLAEIQQNSNATYRVYDWGREQVDRPLHIDKALDVINFEQIRPELPKGVSLEASTGMTRELLCRNSYFTVERFNMTAASTFEGNLDGSTLEIWGVLSGNGLVQFGSQILPVDAVRFVLLPAALGEFAVGALTDVEALRVHVEPPQQLS